MCRMPKQLRSCVNRKEPQTEAETDLKQIIIRPRQLFIITFFSLLSSSSVFGDLDNLLLWLVCWLRCSLRFIFRRLHLSLIATTACNNMPKKKPVPSSTLIQHIAKKISSADTLQPRPHFRKFSACVCACVYSFSYLFSFFQRFVLRFTCRKSHKIH